MSFITVHKFNLQLFEMQNIPLRCDKDKNDLMNTEISCDGPPCEFLISKKIILSEETCSTCKDNNHVVTPFA